MNVPKFCRIAIIVDDMPSFTEEAGRLLGMDFVRPLLDEQFEGFTVMFGEHGLEPISIEAEGISFAQDGSLIEVAIDVANASETRAKLAEGGYVPIVDNFLPAPGASEYLFGRDFHGLPLMVCTAGDNEIQMREQGPFAALDEASLPKIGCVSLVVEDIDTVAADLTRYFGMTFVETDPAGMGTRALVGAHRIKLIEGPSAALAGLEMPLAAIEFMHDDIEAARRRFVAAGYAVVAERPLVSGGSAYYFGATVQGMPVSIYPAAADAEILGQPAGGQPDAARERAAQPV
jgi:hypothetical protein